MAGPLVPYAFCFQPTDQQIISFFLYKIAVKRQLLPPPHDEYVHEEDLFDFKEPWEIWEEYGGDQDLYFFCEFKKTVYKQFTDHLTHKQKGHIALLSRKHSNRMKLIAFKSQSKIATRLKLFDGRPNTSSKEQGLAWWQFPLVCTISELDNNFYNGLPSNLSGAWTRGSRT
ncbi:uncharacterized protein LOC125479454 [Pyrus x bretschneideri]|uniref:uncharacterized protein LOC125479454 n=1 Tax=Pyrus x bretschneideri TaxID=225117 RepID=UPI002030B7C2|nr:uncharacterized protein LOC125479454 [Pyrus x bretschneideri]